MTLTFWGNVRRLLREELRRIGFGYLWQIVMMVYFAFFISLMARTMNSTEHSDYVLSNIMLDFMLMVSIGMMGFAFSRDYMKYWKNNRLSSKLKFYRSLPISTEEIVVSRLLTLIVTTIYSGIIYFASFYLISTEIRSAMQGWGYIGFALAWIGYSFTVGSFFIYVELGFKEKTYFWISCGAVPVFMAVPVILWLLDVHAVQSSIRIVKEYGVLLPAIALTVGVASLLIGKRIAVDKLNRRNMT
ncbi:hypothetical protein [Paenibacillus contaminans]|uniref:ABC transporter permease n=1 Tax=Paenibacillus contaminans TaxID=450362 RepID=A0A329LV77_9BACL|nr:hypothetical protein [Paenibacillus contaminans]RAV10463.1 hypothetical protein DQG23_37720 [Paenibacillus contaminans]